MFGTLTDQLLCVTKLLRIVLCCTRSSTNIPINKQQLEEEEPLDFAQIKLVYSVILAPSLSFMILAFLDARCCRINDYFHAGSILQALVGFLDFVSDGLFAIQLTLISIDSPHGKVRQRVLLLTVASYVFIALPMILGFAQLLRENQKEWIHSVQLRNWMKKHSYFVYIVSLLSGSSFNAVALANCEAFYLSMFCMGLSKRSKMKFNSNRLWSVVMFEVK